MYWQAHSGHAENHDERAPDIGGKMQAMAGARAGVLASDSGQGARANNINAHCESENHNRQCAGLLGLPSTTTGPHEGLDNDVHRKWPVMTSCFDKSGETLDLAMAVGMSGIGRQVKRAPKPVNTMATSPGQM